MVYEHRFAAGLTYFRCTRFAPFILDVGHHHGGPFAGQYLCIGEPQTLGRAGD